LTRAIMAVAALATLGAGALALESAGDQGTPACCAKRAQAAATRDRQAAEDALLADWEGRGQVLLRSARGQDALHAS
jgi:hypothetical protein